MEILLSKILSQIRHQEDKLASELMPTAEEAYQMTLFLNEMMQNVKAKVLKTVLKMKNRKLTFQEHQTTNLRKAHLL